MGSLPDLRRRVKMPVAARQSSCLGASSEAAATKTGYGSAPRGVGHREVRPQLSRVASSGISKSISELKLPLDFELPFNRRFVPHRRAEGQQGELNRFCKGR